MLVQQKPRAGEFPDPDEACDVMSAAGGHVFDYPDGIFATLVLGGRVRYELVRRPDGIYVWAPVAG